MIVEEPKDQGETENHPPLPPHPVLKNHYDQDKERSAVVKRLFDASAPHYDRISALMSLGTDKFYRRRVLRQNGLAPGMTMLDLACGTGMVSGPAQEIVGPEGCVVSVDPSPGMLQEAIERGRVNRAVLGKGEQLPLADGVFDFLCIGFALRHVADLHEAMSECRRVLKPGGKALMLEVTPPASKLSYQLFRFYLKSVVPKVTRVSTKNPDAESLMAYFWDTLEFGVPPATVLGALKVTGFGQVSRHVIGGIFTEYRAVKT